MDAIILNTSYNYDLDFDSNPFKSFIGIFIDRSPYFLKVGLSFFQKKTSLKSIHIEKLIGSKIEFEFIKKGELLKSGLNEICKYDNSYLRYLKFDMEYISTNENEIKFSKVTRKEFFFEEDAYSWYHPKLKLYSGSTLLSKINVYSLSDFYLCLLKEIDIFRINGCYCENCVETKSDKIGYTIDLRVDADKIKSVNDLNSKKNNKIMELFERVKYKIHFTPNTLDENLIDELKIFMQ